MEINVKKAIRYTDYKFNVQHLPKRENIVIGVIGHNRTGKTTIAIKLAKYWKKSRPKHKVFAFDPQNRFINQNVELESKEIIPLVDERIELIEQETWFDRVLGERNCLLILDDYRILNPKNLPNPKWNELMSYRGAYNIDIIYICHAPSLVLNILSNFTNLYFIFYTLSRSGEFEKKIPHYDLCQTATNIVRNYVTENGKGEYPNFPYMIVDTIKDEIKAVNMNLKNNKYGLQRKF